MRRKIDNFILLDLFNIAVKGSWYLVYLFIISVLIVDNDELSRSKQAEELTGSNFIFDIDDGSYTLNIVLPEFDQDLGGCESIVRSLFHT